MKILVICQYYYPEPFKITDICEELVKLGHEVSVITGIPNYPMGEIYEGYRNGENRDEIRNGVKIHRCPIIARKSGAVYRALNYYSFVWSSIRYVKKMQERFDVVFVNQLSPVMMAYAALTYKKRFNIKTVLYCLDLWPESLVLGGIKKNSLIYKYFHKVSSKLYRGTDIVLVTSQSFKKYFAEEFGINDVKFLPQYAEDFFTPEMCRKQPDEYVDLMFAGNIGAAQSIDTIIEAAKLTEHIEKLRWHIVGDGSEYNRLRKNAGKNVIFYGRQPISDMPKYYAMADAMLITLIKDEVLSYTLPGKVQTYMAAGKPIIGAIDGEAKLVIDEADCGFCTRAENPQALAESAISFCNVDKEKLGKNAEAYYLQNFSKKNFMKTLIEFLK